MTCGTVSLILPSDHVQLQPTQSPFQPGDRASIEAPQPTTTKPVARPHSAPDVCVTKLETARTLESIEKSQILSVLGQTNWRIEGDAAQVLNLHPNTLRSRIKKLGLQRPTS